MASTTIVGSGSATRTVDTTLNVYTQVLDDSVRAAAQKVGVGLFTIRKRRAS